MSIFNTCKFTLKRECLLAIRSKGQWLNPMIFFVMVTSLFPLSTIGQQSIYQVIAPSIIWVGVLLAALLSLDYSFRDDFDKGTFEQWSLSPQPLWLLMLLKAFSHWLINLFPMVLMAPIVGYSLQLPLESLSLLTISLLIGTPILSFVGMIGVCLTLGLKNSGVLLALILLPLFIPVLVFGSGALSASLAGIAVGGHLAILGALLALSISFAPLGASFALRISLL